MTNRNKAKGDMAERELSAKLSDLLGIEVRRKLGAGRLDDVGDLDGLDGWVGQVAWRPGDILRAYAEKPVECELQQLHAGTTFGVTFVRHPRGIWRAVQTLPQWATVYREVTDAA